MLGPRQPKIFTKDLEEGFVDFGQGLNAELQERLAEKDAEIDELRSKQAAMEMQLAALTRRLEG